MSVGEGETARAVVVTGREIDDLRRGGAEFRHFHREGRVINAVRVLIRQHPGFSRDDNTAQLRVHLPWRGRQPAAEINYLTPRLPKHASTPPLVRTLHR